MKRLLLTLTLLGLAIPATANAGSSYHMQWHYGWSTTERTSSGSCSTVSGLSTGLLSGSARMACTGDSGSTTATWGFRLACTPLNTPSVYVAYGAQSGPDPDVRLRTSRSGSSVQVQLRMDGEASAVIQRVSIGYYC
jgi:hypothetical protein